MPKQTKATPLVKVLLAIICVSGLGSCANTQHKISVEPELYVKQADFGKGKQVTLKVVDKRSQFAIFKRKAAPKSGLRSAFHTVTIVPRSSIADPIFAKVENGLRQLGFRPARGATTKRKLLLEVLQWRMKSQHQVSAGKVHAKVDTAIRVTAKNGEKQFKKIYKSSMKKSTRMLVGKFKNENFVNNGLSLALQKIFEDKKLLVFLAE